MEKIIIESLRQENNRYKKEKEESDNSVKQYKQLKVRVRIRILCYILVWMTQEFSSLISDSHQIGVYYLLFL